MQSWSGSLRLWPRSLNLELVERCLGSGRLCPVERASGVRRRWDQADSLQAFSHACRASELGENLPRAEVVGREELRARSLARHGTCVRYEAHGLSGPRLAALAAPDGSVTRCTKLYRGLIFVRDEYHRLDLRKIASLVCVFGVTQAQSGYLMTGELLSKMVMNV
jgi:hypothetical protein